MTPTACCNFASRKDRQRELVSTVSILNFLILDYTRTCSNLRRVGLFRLPTTSLWTIVAPTAAAQANVDNLGFVRFMQWQATGTFPHFQNNLR